jgi:predicted transposase/invertase (TIGR01784 family)
MGEGTKLEYTFKSDVLFKMMFVKYPALLKKLVAALLGIKSDSIQQFEVINTEIPPEEIGKKKCRLDILMVVDDKKVNLEIQVEDEGNYPVRSLFYWARVFSSALPAGEDYLLLPRTIIISIIFFRLFDWEEVHSEFQALEVRRHTALTDKMSLHYFELPKLKGIDSIIPGNEQEFWLALFNAETEEEITKIKENGGEIMSDAIQAYRSITADEKFRHIELLREMAEHDEAQRMGNARRQGEKLGEERADAKWQNVLAEKDAEIERLRAELQARHDENK